MLQEQQIFDDFKKEANSLFSSYSIKLRKTSGVFNIATLLSNFFDTLYNKADIYTSKSQDEALKREIELYTRSMILDFQALCKKKEMS